jgi:multidrug efflux system outer membrane protein
MKLFVRLLKAKHANRVIATAIACSMLLVLPACQIPKLRSANLGLGLPENYKRANVSEYSAPLAAVVGGASVANIPEDPNSAENSGQLRVEEFYNDPALTNLVCQAVATNRELKILEEEIQVARAEVLSRRGAFLPLAAFRAAAGWDQNSAFTPLGAAEKQLEYLPGRHFPATPGASMLGFNYLIPIDIWRELRNARDAAIQRYRAAIERRNYFVTRMVADIAENYYGLMALDQRILTLDFIIEFQQQSLEAAQRNLAGGRDTDLPVQRFLAEVRKNQSEKLIVRQEIIEVQNRINFLAGRLPQRVERNAAGFFDLTIHALGVGFPAQLLQNRPDIRQAELEVAAAGLDVKVARAHFFPRLDITGGIGYQAFNPKYLFDPEALIFNTAGELAVPVLNKAAIRAEYLTANARQLESVYNYQRVILNAVVEVINRLSMVENYSRSLELKRQQLTALAAAVDNATRLYRAARTTYLDVLIAQRDLLDARTVFINTKRQQLSAIVNVYQALGGGYVMTCPPPDRRLDGLEPAPLPPLPQLPPPRRVQDALGAPQLAEPRKEKDAP